MSLYKPADLYIKTVAKLKDQLQRLNRKKAGLAWLRLATFLASVVAAWLFWPFGWAFGILAFVLFFSIFLFFVFRDNANNDAINNTILLQKINEDELLALDHQFLLFDDGNTWKPAEHDYANDLDIFGRASLYQYINRTRSQQGSRLLADWLLSPASPSEIAQRHESVKELRFQSDWRQQLQAFGSSKALTIATEQNLLQWLAEKNQFIDKANWRWIRFVIPAISCSILALHLAGFIPENIFYPSMLFFLAFAFAIAKMIMPAYAKLNRITAELETLSDSIDWIEKAKFESPLLQHLQQAYKSGDSQASRTINRLKKILDRLDYRFNIIVYIPLSIFLLWDLQQIFALEKWKTKNRLHIADWISSLAQIEVLCTLGNLSFNHPQWSVPVVTEKEGVFDATALGHPLIPHSRRVNNSFTTEGINQISLITGSNMAGKSTFLRSIGINTVLAMMGAPVCADSLVLSPVRIMSSMRVSDNLEESTSTFYAELKKLKSVIEAVNKSEKVLLLLDEILRGTNSADRHTGSKALVKQLIHHKAVGLVATHDLELAKLANEFPGNIHNYHFDVQVAQDELYFDYKLKTGICQSMNASILMKKIGIEL